MPSEAGLDGRRKITVFFQIVRSFFKFRCICSQSEKTEIPSLFIGAFILTVFFCKCCKILPFLKHHMNLFDFLMGGIFGSASYVSYQNMRDFKIALCFSSVMHFDEMKSEPGSYRIRYFTYRCVVYYSLKIIKSIFQF